MAKKAFNELTEQGKKTRIAKYEAQNAKYGLKEGLFRITGVTRHEDRTVTYNGNTRTVAAFGFNVVPIKGVDAADFPAGKFGWVNQLVDIKAGAKVVDAVMEMKEQLDSKTVNSIPASITYKKVVRGSKTYFNANSVYRRTLKGSAKTTSAATTKTDDAMPYED